MLNITLLPNYYHDDVERLSFNWTCTQFGEMEVVIQLDFYNPLYVSHGGTDMIYVQVLNNTFFQTKFSSTRLSERYLMSKKIGSQMPSNLFTKVLASSGQPFKTSADVSVVTNALISLLYGGSMSYIFGLINTLQMNLHLPMIEGVDFPQNVIFLYSILLPLASMDILPTEYSTELIFTLSTEQDKPYSDSLEELGYESHSALLNLGSLFFYLGVLVLRFAYLLTKQKCISKKKLSQMDLSFNLLIQFFIEGEMEILISCYLNLYSPQLRTNSDYFQYYLSFILLAIVLLVLPASFVFMLTRPKKELDFKVTQDKYGALYQDLRTNKL